MIDRPQFSDIDAWGATHVGNVRRENQDHYFLGCLARGVRAERTSYVPEDEHFIHMERLASLAVVADGVGGVGGGEVAAHRAVEDLVASVARFYFDAEYQESQDPEVFTWLLHDAALAVHGSLLNRAEEEGGGRRFATTLTLFLGLWPHAYILQVGDSRCYVYRDGELSQLTEDQTMAQELVDAGVLTRPDAERTRWAHILSSALGGEQAAPVVTRLVREWGTVFLFCSDGLTKHVSDARIKERLANMISARQVVEQLLQDALDGGGTDNITLIVGRSVPKSEG